MIARRWQFWMILTCMVVASVASPVRAADDADLLFARQAFNDGFYDLAADRLERFIRTNPRNDEAHLLLGRCFYYRGNSARALEELDLILASPAGNPLQDEALYWAGEVYLKNGDNKKAIEYYERVIDEFASSRYLGAAYYSKGWALYKLGLFDEAIGAFREVVTRFPFEKTAIESSFKIGECLYALGNYDAAATALAQFVKKFPVSEQAAEAHYLLGESYFCRANYTGAIDAFEKALAVAPRASWAPFASYRLARSFLATGQYDKSAAAFTACSAAAAPHDFLKQRSLIGLAETYEKLNRRDEALAVYTDVIRTYPTSPSAAEAYYRKAQLLFDAGRYEDADEVCVSALAQFDNSTYTDAFHYERGWIALARGRTDTALAEFATVERISADTALIANALCKIGDIYLARKEYAQATEYFDTVLKKYADTPWADYAQYEIGILLGLDGKFDQAILAYQSLLVNFPSTKLREKAILNLGLAYVQQGDPGRALNEFERLHAEFPNGESRDVARFYAANALYGLDRYAPALQYYNEVIASSADKAIVMLARYQVGWCQYNANNETEAVRTFESFLRDYPTAALAHDVRYWFAEYYHGKGNDAKARSYLDALIDSGAPDELVAQALYLRATIAADEGNADEALRQWAALIERFPVSPLVNAAYRKMAAVKVKAKDYAAAIAYYRHALTRENTEVNAQIQYEIAETLDEKGDLAEAAAEYLKVPYLYANGTFWAVRAELKCAQLFERLERWQDAKNLYEKLARMNVEESALAKKRLEWIQWRTTK